MDVLIFCFVLLALTAFVARPLYERAQRTLPAPKTELEARHQVVVRALSDLEIDRASGAVDESTYDAERLALEGEGTEVLRGLDGRQIGGAAPPEPPALR